MPLNIPPHAYGRQKGVQGNTATQTIFGGNSHSVLELSGKVFCVTCSVIRQAVSAWSTASAEKAYAFNGSSTTTIEKLPK